MFNLMKKCILPLAAIATINVEAYAQSNELYFYNWSDYIAPDTISNFEKEYGIKVHQILMDSNEILEAKMMAGSSGYDIIAPSLHILKRLSELGLLEPLDKSKLPNWKNLDPQKLKKIATVDQDNTYGVPYMELSTGIGFNEDKVRQVMGKDFKLDSFDDIFNDKIASKLKQCGITFLDSPSDMICSALIYLGKDPQSTNPKDYALAEELLKHAVKNVIYLHNSKYIDDLASGEVCVSVAWSGDAQLAATYAKEAGLDNIKYIIPKEGALMGYDMFAIPKDADNKENAYLFLNYLLRPEVIADITNYIHYANPNKAATKYVNKEILDNPGIYYSEDLLSRMYIVVPPENIQKELSKSFNRVKMDAAQ